MNSSVPDGDGSPVYTKDVHTHTPHKCGVARQPQCKLDFQVDSRRQAQHTYNKVREIYRGEGTLCTSVYTRSVVYRRVYTEVHHQFVHKYKIVFIWKCW